MHDEQSDIKFGIWLDLVEDIYPYKLSSNERKRFYFSLCLHGCVSDAGFFPPRASAGLSGE